MPLPLWGLLFSGVKLIDECRIFGAHYRFSNPYGKNIVGYRGRVEINKQEILSFLDIDFLKASKLSIGLELSRDNIRNTSRFFEVRLRIPLQGGNQRYNMPYFNIRRRLADRIIRDVDIITNEKTTFENPASFNPAQYLGINFVTTNDIYWIDLDAPANGDGSFLYPSNTMPRSNLANKIVLIKGGSYFDNAYLLYPGNAINNLLIVGLKDIPLPAGVINEVYYNGTRQSFTRPVLQSNDPTSYFTINGNSGNYGLVGLKVEFLGSVPNVGSGIRIDDCVNTQVLLKDINIVASQNTVAGIDVFSSGTSGGTSNVTIENVRLSNQTGQYNHGIRIWDRDVAGATENVNAYLRNITVNNSATGITLDKGDAAAPAWNIYVQGGVDTSSCTNDLYLDSAGGTSNLNLSTTYGSNSFTAGTYTAGTDAGWTTS